MNRLPPLALILLAGPLAAAGWHHPLWLGRGDAWRARFAVTITNPSDVALEGAPVAITVGDQPCQAPLAGARAEEVRVTDARGTQLLHGLWAPDGATPVATGPVPAGATLVLPAVCGPRATTTCHVYFANPHAWGLADSFEERPPAEPNGDFEAGSNGIPAGWRASQADAAHRLAWSAERPFSGARCLQAQADPGAEGSWFGFVRSDFAVVPGARCTIRVRVRGERVVGSAGWYVHVGDEQDPQRINQTVRTGDGTFDWKEQVITFTVPAGATRLQTGSVLRGTGTAWFDAFALETDRPAPRPGVQAGPVERLSLTELGAGAAWPDGPPGGEGTAPAAPGRWLHRLPVRVFNLQPEPAANVLAVVDLEGAARGIAVPEFLLTFNGAAVESCRLGERLLFTCSPPARSALTCYLHVADTGAKRAAATPAAPTAGSAIPSDQVPAGAAGEVDAGAFARLLHAPVNLVRNPDFESGGEAPDGWTRSGADSGAVFALGSPGLFGRRHARLSVPREAGPAWRGWQQEVPVTPGKTYLYGAWLAGENLAGPALVHAHLRNARGEVDPDGMLGIGPPVSGTTPWTPRFDTTTPQAGIASLQLHLTMEGCGTLGHDGAFVAECLVAEAGEPESAPLPPAGFAAWPVDPVVKVFRETQPAGQPAAPCRVALARNEEEALQLALRAGREIPRLTVALDPPKDPSGHELRGFTIGWVGWVPVDHRTSYYQLTTPPWELKFPTGPGSSDGWAGWWPDPIRPTPTGALAANRTEAVRISFRTDADTPAGSYAGTIRLLAGDELLEALPLAVTVWDFTLPAASSCAAIYDVRPGPRWLGGGDSPAAVRERLLRFMASKRVCPDEVGAAPEFTRDSWGRITCDFTAYDRAARLYFDELRFPVSYTPNLFYLFGWEHPPRQFLGEQPYDGRHPWQDVDRSRLRQAYKDVYQECLRLYWEHVKAMGWADRLVLYLSDEPFLTKPHIVAQMKALCAMIHEVDPRIPVYSSTWNHCPEWNGCLDVWGVGHHGCFPVAEMRARVAAGERIWFTTDGQMCTDTPLCAIERLLPHYCFHYGAEAYEFWGVSWLTHDPWRFGWHSYIGQSTTPGESYFVRYPNGDGYLLYPGAPAGFDGPVSTIRLEAARDGVEDYEYLKLLQARAADPEAARLLAEFAALVGIPNAGGRFSTRILPDPARLADLRLRAGTALERRD